MFLAVALTPFLRHLDQVAGWMLLGFGLDGARALLAMLAASMLTLLVFVLPALLIAVQVASTQLTPRVIAATFLRDRPVQFTPLLRAIGKRHLDTEAILDETGSFGVVFRTPDGEDYGMVAASEIRQYGGGSLQVVRRLRAMLDGLIASLPGDRRPPLEIQPRILGHAAARNFPDAEDLESAGAAQQRRRQRVRSSD